MSAGSLTSNHVNYLIWRYLQESGHGEAAVKLQRDWDTDPQSLSFAPHIRSHALVSLVQKGLQYHEIEQSIISQARHNGDRLSPSPSSIYFFGPGTTRAPLSPNGEDMDGVACASRSSSRPRKHARDSGANGVPMDPATQAPAPKRHRKSNGVVESSSNGDTHEHEHEHEHGSGNAMEIDRNGYSHPESPTGAAGVEDADAQTNDAQAAAQPDAHAQSPAPAQPRIYTLTLTHGKSVGVQSDQYVYELGPEKLILDLDSAVGDERSESTHNAANGHGHGHGNGTGTERGSGQSVMHTRWHPKEPTVLATAGEALARIWNVSRSDSPKPHVDLLAPGDRSLVTAMSWSPDGEYLAVATRSLASGWVGQVTIWTMAGVMRDVLPAAHDMMLALRWNPSGTLLLGIASSGKGSSILIWDPSTGQAMQPVELEDTIVDAAWEGDLRYSVCGEKNITRFIMSDRYITLVMYKEQSEEAKRNWSMIRWDPVSSTIAAAAEESAHLAIIGPGSIIQATVAHSDALTALSFQPRPKHTINRPTDRCILATSSLDGTLKLWDAKRPFTILHRLFIGGNDPAMALKFTPDGDSIAAASFDKVFIWETEEGGLPQLGWIGDPVKWRAGRAAGEKGAEGDDAVQRERGQDHSLSWDAGGEQLAFGLGSQIAILAIHRMVLHFQ